MSIINMLFEPNEFAIKAKRSQKILWNSLLVFYGFVLAGLKNLIVVAAVLIDLQDGSHVAATIAVVGGRPHRN